ncbi:hypothetical protein ACLOJK_016270 [Asimina triloba]
MDLVHDTIARPYNAVLGFHLDELLRTGVRMTALGNCTLVSPDNIATTNSLQQRLQRLPNAVVSH